MPGNVKVITIDPGHGGSDPGAVYEDIREKNIALDVSKKLRNMLEKDYIVTMTRNHDWKPSFSKRTDNANILLADIFVSIHCNSFSDSQANGIETLHSPKSENGIKLADNIQSKLVDNLGMTDRGIKPRDNLFVLKYTKMPAVLCELGFISNQSDREKLLSEKYQNRMAESIAKGIKNYFKELY